MATLQSVVDRITRDHLNRTTLDSEAVRAVQAAIRHYERERFYWNEGATALACVVSQSYVTVPTDLFQLDNFQITYAGETIDLIEKPFGTVLQMNAVNTYTSVPTHFARRANRFYLTAIPDSAYAMPVYYLKKLTELSSNAMTATNDWLANAEDLIVYHATKLMWANVIRDTNEAAKFFALEKTEYATLCEERDQRTITRIKPTRF